jgi:serine/threonine-protein kinase
MVPLQHPEQAACRACGQMLEVGDYQPFQQILCPECRQPTVVPALFADYLLLEKVGEREMFSVYRAVDPFLHRDVALKIMKPSFGSNPLFAEPWLTEVRAVAGLNHKNIVQVFTFGQEGNQPYVETEWVKGIGLDTCIDPDVQQEEIGWLDVMWQVALGLSAAEKKGLLHGDIKPSNLLMDKNGVAKIADFGVARFQKSRSDGVSGTPLYLAPEKVKGAAGDTRSDQFSFGATFYHVLSGHPPFTGGDDAAILQNRFDQPTPDIRWVSPHFSRDLSELLQRVMATQPENRFPSFAALAEEINSLPLKLEAERLRQNQEMRRMEVEARELRRQELRQHAVWVGGALLLILAVYVYVTFYR